LPLIHSVGAVLIDPQEKADRPLFRLIVPGLAAPGWQRLSNLTLICSKKVSRGNNGEDEITCSAT
jgi:hypothetical protein